MLKPMSYQSISRNAKTKISGFQKSIRIVSDVKKITYADLNITIFAQIKEILWRIFLGQLTIVPYS